MVLAQKQEYRSMEQDKKPRDKPTHLWATNLSQTRQGWGKDSLSISGAGNTGQLCIKE